MFRSIFIAPLMLFSMFTCESEVSAQCKDTLIYKLTDIQHLIANLTAKLEMQEEKHEKDIEILTVKYEAEITQLRNNITYLKSRQDNYHVQKGMCRKRKSKYFFINSNYY